MAPLFILSYSLQTLGLDFSFQAPLTIGIWGTPVLQLYGIALSLFLYISLPERTPFSPASAGGFINL